MINDFVEQQRESEFDSRLKRLKEIYTTQKLQIEHLREELKKAQSEAYKDEELARMKDEYERMKSDYFHGFPISEDEEERIDEWCDNHLREKHKEAFSDPSYFGAIGGNFKYEFVVTSIGVVGTVRCSCGDSYTFKELK